MRRTQIYLEPEQHRALMQESAKKGVSLAGLIREIVADYLNRGKRPGKPGKEIYMGLVGLGQSGLGDVSERHDYYLAEALKSDHNG